MKIKIIDTNNNKITDVYAALVSFQHCRLRSINDVNTVRKLLLLQVKYLMCMKEGFHFAKLDLALTLHNAFAGNKL